AVPVCVERGSAAVRGSTGRAAQSRPRAPLGGGGSAAARTARYADAPCAEAQLRDAPASRRRGPSGASGTARPREPVVDPDLHGGGRGATSRRLSPRPPPRLSRGPGGRKSKAAVGTMNRRGVLESGVSATPRQELG